MSEDIRKYLTEVVRTFESRKKVRGFSYAGGQLKKWEQKHLDGAKRLLREEQSDLPLRAEPSEVKS